MNNGGSQDSLKHLNIPHILVVDDNEELRSFLDESLSPYYNISDAEDGRTGLAKSKRRIS